jgi:hypothetical protein
LLAIYAKNIRRARLFLSCKEAVRCLRLAPDKAKLKV